MNIQQPKIDLKNNFELYLEGVKVDFLSITISETEGGIPAASITFPSNSGATRILPGTIVQVFGYYHQENKSFLLFEGEITAINYQKGESSKVAVLKAISLLGSMIKAKFRPADAFITKELKDATGVQGTTNIIYNLKNENSSTGPVMIKDFNNIKNTKPATLRGTSNDIGISSVFGLTDEFKKMLSDDQPGGKGDFIPMLQQFNLYFENNDLFYGLRSLAYKFGRTLFAAPNPELLNKIKVDLFYESLNKLQSSGISDVYGEAPYTLMQIMTEFQRYLHYGFISPANYTACMPFYIEQNVTRWEPLRIMYMPRLEIGPPALCNVFFPEQVNSFTYSREMMAEPTRVVGKATVPLLNSVNRPIDFSPCAVYPEIEFDGDKAAGNFTTEETYRGINYKITTYSNLQSDLISKLKTTRTNGKESSKGSNIKNEEMDKGEIGYLIRPFAYMDYLDLRYRQRQAALNAEWSPYRIIGLPGVILDSDGISIVGVVNSIETTISAQGTAISRVTFRSTRMLFDGEFEKTVFSTIPEQNKAGNEKYIIHDLTNDGMISTNELLYNQDLYSFENIGKDIYTYITNGMLSANEGFLTVKNNYSIFTYAEGKLSATDLVIPIHPRIDNSVLHYVPKTDKADGFAVPDEYNVKTEIRNTYLLYKALSELRKDYESKKYKMDSGEKKYDMQQAYNFMYAINRRNVITKEDYFNFIGANPGRSYQNEDAHDSKTIFSEGVENLRSEILNRANIQYTKVITTNEAKSESLKLRLSNYKVRLTEVTGGNLNTTQAELVKYYETLGYTNKKANELVSTKYWPEVITLRENITNTQNELDGFKKPEISSEDIDEELYKPFNMTRRMHVLLALKDSTDIAIKNNTSKIRITK